MCQNLGGPSKGSQAAGQGPPVLRERPTSQSPRGPKGHPRSRPPPPGTGGPGWRGHSHLALPPRGCPEPGPLSAWRPLPPKHLLPRHLPAPVTLMSLPLSGAPRTPGGGQGAKRGRGHRYPVGPAHRLGLGQHHGPGASLCTRPGWVPGLLLSLHVPGLMAAKSWEMEGGLLTLSTPDGAALCHLPAPLGSHMLSPSPFQSTGPLPGGPSRPGEGCRPQARDGARLRSRGWKCRRSRVGPGEPEGHRLGRGRGRAGPGPGRAALVSLLGAQPPRQVQETDRACRSPRTPGAPQGGAQGRPRPLGLGGAWCGVPSCGSSRYGPLHRAQEDPTVGPVSLAARMAARGWGGGAPRLPSKTGLSRAPHGGGTRGSPGPLKRSGRRVSWELGP